MIIKFIRQKQTNPLENNYSISGKKSLAIKAFDVIVWYDNKDESDAAEAIEKNKK
jgi:hypothetical protein